MATIAGSFEDWAAGDQARTGVYASEPGVIVRWANEAQLRFADRSECLQSVWSPTITSSGNIALPADFLREIKNRVKWTQTIYLVQLDYPTANIQTFTSVGYYSIWNGTFYVWQATSGTPTIPYIKKPTAITTSTLSSADWDIPTEYQRVLFNYFDSMMARRAGDIPGSMTLLSAFDNAADQAYATFHLKRGAVPVMRGSFF